MHVLDLSMVTPWLTQILWQFGRLNLEISQTGLKQSLTITCLQDKVNGVFKMVLLWTYHMEWMVKDPNTVLHILNDFFNLSMKVGQKLLNKEKIRFLQNLFVLLTCKWLIVQFLRIYSMHTGDNFVVIIESPWSIWFRKNC